MKTYLNFFILFFVLLSLFSCERVRYDCLNASDFGLKSDVCEIRETIYEVKGRPDKITKLKDKKSLYYRFNSDGKIVFLEETENKQVNKYEYSYSKKGKLLGVKSNAIIDFKPYYNVFGDLYRVKYSNLIGDDLLIGYFYDDDGFLISKKEKFIGEETNSDYYYDSDGILLQIHQKIGDNLEIMQDCDSLGNIVKEEHYSLNPRKILQQFVYQYKYDSSGNWLSKMQIGKKNAISLVEREITYYNQIKKHDKNIFHSYLLNLEYRVLNSLYTGDAPTNILIIILIILSILIFVFVLVRYREKLLLNFFGGSVSSFYNDHLNIKKIWVYNKEPYVKIISILFVAVLSFCTALILIFIFGGVVLGVFWIIKILLLILVVVGWLFLVGGALCAFAGFSDEGGCGMIIGGAIVALVGSSIVSSKRTLEVTGNKLVNDGLNFMNTLNMFDWGIGLFTNYWDLLLFLFFAPLVVFLSIAFVIIVFNFLLVSIEWIITKIYNIRRPCSTCGSTKEPIYLTPNSNKVHPIKLSPGVYGVFYQISPINGAKMPTMLLNGRWKLKRKCSNCGSELYSTIDKNTKQIGFGTDLHIGVVGHRSSGKSYLLYSGLQLLMNEYSSKFFQIESDGKTRISDVYKRISKREGIPTDSSNSYKAIQLIYRSPYRPVPYHLFFYDVAGEKFDVGSVSHRKALDFYKNVKSIMFLIDPTMIDFTGIPISQSMRNWLQMRNLKNTEKYNVSSILTILKEILNGTNNKSKNVDFSFVCVKSDLKYFDDLGYDSTKLLSSDIEQYLRKEMGLNSLVDRAMVEFKSVNYYSVSIFENKNNLLRNLFLQILKSQGLRI